jgi:hypothetical protein
MHAGAPGAVPFSGASCKACLKTKNDRAKNKRAADSEHAHSWSKQEQAIAIAMHLPPLPPLKKARLDPLELTGLSISFCRELWYYFLAWNKHSTSYVFNGQDAAASKAIWVQRLEPLATTPLRHPALPAAPCECGKLAWCGKGNSRANPLYRTGGATGSRETACQYLHRALDLLASQAEWLVRERRVPGGGKYEVDWAGVTGSARFTGLRS